jgi:toxin ParE1/3/4
VKIQWLPTAEGNRDTKLGYIGERDPWAAIDMGDAIDAALLHLAAHPRIGRPGRVVGSRELVISGTPYIIAYRVEPDAVVIIRLLHGAEQWPARL